MDLNICLVKKKKRYKLKKYIIKSDIKNIHDNNETLIFLKNYHKNIIITNI